ncbi:hypothetical protein ACNKHS_01865 [Shigella flexneri]
MQGLLGRCRPPNVIRFLEERSLAREEESRLITSSLGRGKIVRSSS